MSAIAAAAVIYIYRMTQRSCGTIEYVDGYFLSPRTMQISLNHGARKWPCEAVAGRARVKLCRKKEGRPPAQVRNREQLLPAQQTHRERERKRAAH